MEKSQKNSFILYKSFFGPIEEMDDVILGKLFRAIFQYQINGIENVDPDIMVPFKFFLNQFKVDKEKYQKIIDRNRGNGAKGGRPKKYNDLEINEKDETQENPINPMGILETQQKPNDNDNDNDNDFNLGQNSLLSEKTESSSQTSSKSGDSQKKKWENSNPDHPLVKYVIESCPRIRKNLIPPSLKEINEIYSMAPKALIKETIDNLENHKKISSYTYFSKTLKNWLKRTKGDSIITTGQKNVSISLSGIKDSLNSPGK